LACLVHEAITFMKTNIFIVERQFLTKEISGFILLRQPHSWL